MNEPKRYKISGKIMSGYVGVRIDPENGLYQYIIRLRGDSKQYISETGFSCPQIAGLEHDRMIRSLNIKDARRNKLNFPEPWEDGYITDMSRMVRHGRYWIVQIDDYITPKNIEIRENNN